MRFFIMYKVIKYVSCPRYLGSINYVMRILPRSRSTIAWIVHSHNSSNNYVKRQWRFIVEVYFQYFLSGAGPGSRLTAVFYGLG